MSATCTRPSCVRSSHVCIKACVLLQGQHVCWCWDVLPTRGIVQKALEKRNGFGDDVVAQQPPHPCLVVHNTVCHVTPCASFLFLNCEWNSVAARNGCCVCGANAFMFSPIACANTCHNAFTNLHSKCTWSTVILLPHLHLSVGCA